MQAVDLTGEAYHHTVGDVATLKELAATLPRGPYIVNIGLCFGTSVMALAEARPDAYIFAVDVKPCDDGVENLKRAGIWQRGQILRILQRSQEIRFPFTVDMVLVDGSHLLADVKADIEVWRERLTSGGLLVVHDYGTPSLPSVKAAVDELMEGYKVILHRETIKAFRVFHNENISHGAMMT